MKTLFAPLPKIQACGMLVAIAMAAGLLGAQEVQSRPTARIRSEISSQQTQLRGSLHPQARPANDAGRMPADTRISGISLYFNRSAAQQADLQALMAAQQDPKSPQYHHWLTPDQFGARFGMAQSDIDKVKSWLEQQGFAIESVARSRNMIRFSGTARQVESAFSTQMHYYQTGGVRHFAASTAVSVPAAIAPAIAGIRNLHDFRPRPHYVRPRGAFTSSQSGNVFFAPGDIATVYDINPLYRAGLDGAGQSIAVVGQSAIDLTDIENFQSAAGLNKKDPTLVLVPNTGTSTVVSGGDEGESDIDLEWAGAIAPGAEIVFVYVGNNQSYSVYDSLQYAVDQNLTSIISFSYASCETELTSNDVTTLESVTAQAAVQGQTVLAASGDQGATACSGDTNLSTAEQQQIVVNYPASSAFVTGLGGTGIDASNGAYSTAGQGYWTAKGSSDEINTALQYIPETSWNDNSAGVLSASGGGTSILIGKPSYQAALTPADGGRDVPDIALYSSPNLPGYLFCTSDTSDWNTTQPPLQKASCDSGFRDASTGSLTVAGGTSFAAPIFAGMLALINQNGGYTNGQGLINPILYELAADGATYASAFHDITTGDNNCSAGTTICGSTTGGYSAGPGYDQVTGLGSVDAANLAAVWPVAGSTTLIPTTTTVLASNTTPASGTPVDFTIKVISNSAKDVPAGTVSVTVDGGSATTQTLDAKGTYGFTTSFTTSGFHTVEASYAGTSTFAASAGAVLAVYVPSGNTGKGTIALSSTPSTLVVRQGTSGDETVTVTPGGGYTGTVLLNFSSSNDTALQNLCFNFTNTDTSGTGSVAVSGASPVTTKLSLDANASDCVTAAAAKPGFHRLGTHLGGKLSRSTPSQPTPNRLPAEAAFAGLLLAGFVGRYARRFRSAAWVVVLAAAGLLMSACSNSVTHGPKNPDKGTYTVTVTGHDSTTSTITGSTTFTLTIN